MRSPSDGFGRLEVVKPRSLTARNRNKPDWNVGSTLAWEPSIVFHKYAETTRTLGTLVTQGGDTCEGSHGSSTYLPSGSRRKACTPTLLSEWWRSRRSESAVSPSIASGGISQATWTRKSRNTCCKRRGIPPGAPDFRAPEARVWRTEQSAGIKNDFSWTWTKYK